MSTTKIGGTWPAVERFLVEEGVALSLDQLLADPAKQRLSALCYIEHGDRVLMLQRLKPPFESHWTAPGGKLRSGEDPRIAIRREVAEETGLAIHEPRLRLIASETGPEHYNWLLFFFRASVEVKGVEDKLLRGPRRSDEGRLDWLPVGELSRHRLPEVEQLLLPFIFPRGGCGAVHFARIRFGDDYNVQQIEVDPLR